MAVIIPDELNNKKDDDLYKRVDTLYQYLPYMKEMIEFWGRNRTKDIDTVNAKVAANTADIEDLEPRIQAYEENLPVSDTAIEATKPLKFDYPNGYLVLNGGTLNSSMNLDDIHYARYGWCYQVQGKPSLSGDYGYFLGFENVQFYFEYGGQAGWRMHMRGWTNSQWYPWGGDNPYEFSGSCTYNLSFGSGYIKAYYYPFQKRVKITFSVYNGTSSTFEVGNYSGSAGAPFTIPSQYRPSSNIGALPIMVKGNDNVWHGTAGTVYTDGKIGQNMTHTAKEMYGTVEYTL